MKCYNLQKIKLLGSVSALVLIPTLVRACACGCGVFDVATETMLPQGPGGMFYINDDYQDQNKNWSDWHSAPAVNNGDKVIQTDFLTLGLQYMFNRSWGAQVELPYDFRHYEATAGGSTSWSSLGDMRIQGIYTGFFPDMSAGITYGVKLPTGNDNHDLMGPNALLDRDTEIGSGSTDLMLGGFYRHTLNSVTHGLYWYSQASLDLPVLIQGGYRPGVELDTALGLYYQGLSVGSVRITPVAQVIPSMRTKDTGDWASGGINDPPVGIVDSGYYRVLLAPGLEIDRHPFMFYADVEFDALQYSRGNQLVAPVLFKFVVSYMF